VRGRLLADDHEVTVVDADVDHRVTLHLEHEDVAVANEVGRHRVDLLDVLLSEDRCTGGDATQQRNGPGGAALGGEAGLGVEQDLDRTRLGRIDPEVALALEGLHVAVDGGRRCQAHRLADLAHRGGIATLGDHRGDVFQGLALAVREALDHRFLL
jgi:hypothetical protein